MSDNEALERNWLIQTGMLTPHQADAITPSDVMRAYRLGAKALEQANAQAEKFERFNYLSLHDLERLLNASEALSNYGWANVTVDCEEARAYLQELLDDLRREISRLRMPQEHLIGLAQRSSSGRADADNGVTDAGPTPAAALLRHLDDVELVMGGANGPDDPPARRNSRRLPKPLPQNLAPEGKNT